MDFFDVIEKRHSYRGPYKAIEIPREDLCKIIQTALKAPSGKNAQTTDFLIIDEPYLVEQFQNLHKSNKAMQQSKAYICCIIDKKPPPIIGNESFQLEDCSAAVENMLLAITALGYASVWMDGWLRFGDNTAIINNLLKLPNSKKIQIILPIGIPKEEGKQPDKKSFAARVCFNAYKAAQ